MLLDYYNTRSELYYHCYIQTDDKARSTFKLSYQERYSSLASLNSRNEQYVNIHIPYTPAEVIIYPCRGRPALLIDVISDHSSPARGDYQYKVIGEWGIPYIHRFEGHEYNDLTVFMTVYDYNNYDASTKTFSTNSSVMEYDIFFGSQPDSNTPGN